MGNTVNTSSLLTGSVNYTEVAISILYFVACIVIGLWANKRTQKNAESFYAGDRSFGLFVSLFAAFAAYASAGTFVGLIGSTYKLGLAYNLCSGLSVLFGWMFSAILVAPFLRAMNIKTTPDFFKVRYNDKAINIMASLIVLIAFTIYITSQFKAAGLSVQYLFKIDYIPAITIITPIIILYVALGGMWAVTITDVIQGIGMAILMFILPVGILIKSKMGIFEMFEEVGKSDPNFTQMLMSPFSYIGMMLTWGCAQFCLPHVVMRITSAKNMKVAQLMLPINGLLYLFSHILYIMVVAAAVALMFPIATAPLEDADFAFFIMVQEIFDSAVIRGMCVSVIIAAMMSSVDSFLLAASAAFANDFLPVVKPNISQETIVKVGTWAVVVIGVICYIFALNPPELLLLMYTEGVSFMLAGFVPAMILGIWWKRANVLGARLSIIFGCGSYAVIIVLERILGLFTLPTAAAICISLPLGLIFMIIGSYIGKPSAPELKNYVDELHEKRFAGLVKVRN